MKKTKRVNNLGNKRRDGKKEQRTCWPQSDQENTLKSRDERRKKNEKQHNERTSN